MEKETKKIKYFLNKHFGKSATIHTRDNFDNTPLIFACFYGKVKIVEYLLNKVDINVENASGHTALDIAISVENDKIIDLLKKSNARRGVFRSIVNEYL